ncbi:MAG: VWA domain-containing protein, partial [Acidobacteriota bacterium]
LSGGSLDLGDLPVTADFVVDEQLLLDEGRVRATVETRVEAGPLRLRPSASLCVFLLLDVDGEAILAHNHRVDVDDFSTVEAMRYVLRADLPEGTRQMNLVVVDAGSGVWGAAPMQTPGGPIAGPSFTARKVAAYEDTWYELTHRQAGGANRTVTTAEEDTGGTDRGLSPEHQAEIEAAKELAKVLSPVPQDVRLPPRPQPGQPFPKPIEKLACEQILRLVPPREPARGNTWFNVLISTIAVEKVVFYLDGKKVDEDRSPPFRARLSLASPAAEQTVRAVAFDGLGVEMAADELKINRLDQPFRVRITGLRGDPASGTVTLSATTSVPPEQRLDRIEVWVDDQLFASSTDRELRMDVPTPNVTPTSFLRVAAFLADGLSIDDVVLLADPQVEEVDVNLVELHAVVTDRKGVPKKDLTAEDFRVVLGGEERPAASFAYADDVPLVMGLMVDTSGSMELLMYDTRRAAAKFLGRTVRPGDAAFLVDFDRQPRLLHQPSGDLASLMRSLGRLQAAGETAMYDAVIFSLLQYEGVRGRRALVVLSDGDDYESSYGPKQVVERARDAGVPVYIIGLGGLDTMRRTFSKRDLERITEGTGGRLYFVESFEELADAYAQIEAELRSQYTLGVYTERDLTPDERREVEVKVPKGLEARAVVGVGSSTGGSP